MVPSAVRQAWARAAPRESPPQLRRGMRPVEKVTALFRVRYLLCRAGRASRLKGVVRARCRGQLLLD
jgi:hypothetical protein